MKKPMTDAEKQAFFTRSIQPLIGDLQQMAHQAGIDLFLFMDLGDHPSDPNKEVSLIAKQLYRFNATPTDDPDCPAPSQGQQKILMAEAVCRDNVCESQTVDVNGGGRIDDLVEHCPEGAVVH